MRTPQRGSLPWRRPTTRQVFQGNSRMLTTRAAHAMPGIRKAPRVHPRSDRHARVRLVILPAKVLRVVWNKNLSLGGVVALYGYGAPENGHLGNHASAWLTGAKYQQQPSTAGSRRPSVDAHRSSETLCVWRCGARLTANEGEGIR